MVTSSAVVGSSAISTAGSQESAIAIMARCNMPPENSNGYCSARLAGSGMRVISNSSTARACAARRFMPACTCSGSAIWSPMVIVGLSEVIGS